MKFYFDVMEGIVEDYEEGIKGDESFTINGVEFEVRRHAAAWGYTLFFTKDSVITGNGQHLRIRYIPTSNSIVYIEEIK